MPYLFLFFYKNMVSIFNLQIYFSKERSNLSFSYIFCIFAQNELL